MSGLEALKAVLAEQIRGYRALLALLQKERGCLVSLDAENIEVLAKEKDTILLRLRLFEEERLRLLKELSARHSLAGDSTLASLARLTGDEALTSLRSQLLSLVQSVAELNTFNKVLTERTLNFTRGAVERLQGPGLRSPQGAVVSREV